MSLRQKTIRGVIWAYGAFVGGRAVNLLTTAILARLLVPESFGLIGFALIVLNFLEAARGLGLNDALIYNDDRVDAAADTAFWLNVALGIAQFSLALLLAPLAQAAIDDPLIVPMLQIMALSFLFTGLMQTHDVLLQKELAFGRRYLPDLLSTIVKGIVSIGLALNGFGVWSLVIGHVVNSIVWMIILWTLNGWRPRWRFDRSKAGDLWRYGRHIFALNLLSIVLTQGNGLIIGAGLGAAQLGYYTIALRLPEIVIINISMVLTRVIFPAFVKIKDDRDQLLRGFLKTTQYTAFLTAAAGFGMAATAPEIVIVIFGDQWAPAVPIFQVLALLGFTSTLAWNAGDVLKAVGRPDISARLLVIEVIYTLGLIALFAASSGLAFYASIGNWIAIAISAVIRLWIISRFLGAPFGKLIAIFRGPIVAGGIMAIGVTVWREAIREQSVGLILASSSRSAR